MDGARSALWKNRDFALVWSGEALSELGSQLSTVAFPLLVLALGGSAAQAGVVGFAKTLPLLLAALPAGVLADRVDRKRLMVACSAGRAVALASVPIALWVGQPPLLQIALVAFVDGTLFACAYVAERGAIAHLVPAEEIPHAVAQNEARGFAAGIVGPPLGGALFGIARFVPFAVDAISYVISTVTVSLTRTRFQEDRQEASRLAPRDVVRGIEWIWARPYFRASALLFAGSNPVFTGMALLALLLAKERGASSAAVGAMFAVVGVGGLTGALISAPLRRRLRARVALLTEQWLIVFVVPLLLVVRAPLLIGLVVAATELLTPLVNSVVSGRRIGLAPDALRSRVQAAAMLITQSLSWLGPLAIGTLFEHLGADATVIALGAWTLLLALAATLTPALRTEAGTEPDLVREAA